MEAQLPLNDWIRVLALDSSANYIYWQFFPKVFLSPCSNIPHAFPGSQVFSVGFCPYPFHPKIPSNCMLLNCWTKWWGPLHPSLWGTEPFYDTQKAKYNFSHVTCYYQTSLPMECSNKVFLSFRQLSQSFCWPKNVKIYKTQQWSYNIKYTFFVHFNSMPIKIEWECPKFLFMGQ